MEIIYNEHRFSEECRCRDCIFSQSIPVPGYERYRVFQDGRIWSHARLPGKFLKSRTRTCGYVEVSLYRDGKLKKMLVHRLVAMAYIPNPDNKPQVDHINRNRSDNRISNLRWATHSENQQNTGKPINNKSGYKSISYQKYDDRWIFAKRINGKQYRKFFRKTKIDALCYKYIFILKLKSGLIF